MVAEGVATHTHGAMGLNDDKLALMVAPILMVLMFGGFFALLEHAIMHSPLGNFLHSLLRKGEEPSETSNNDLRMTVARVVGFIHNTAQVPIAIWAICNPGLYTDRYHGKTELTQVMLCAAGGFFLHDAVNCLLREKPFYVIHGLVCCLAYSSAAFYECAHFYGGLFLMWEISTPFVQLRWILYKIGATDGIAYKLTAILMLLTFGIVRIGFGTYFTWILLQDSVSALWKREDNDSVPRAIYASYCMGALTICSLNYYWFSLMLQALKKVLGQGGTWSVKSKEE